MSHFTEFKRHLSPRNVIALPVVGLDDAVGALCADWELCKLSQDRHGGLLSPQLLIRSLDFTEIEVL